VAPATIANKSDLAKERIHVRTPNRAALLLGVGGLLLASLAVPRPAYAAGNPYGYAQSVWDDLGRIQVSATSDSAITAITAHLYKQNPTVEVAAVDDFQLISGSADNGVWQTPDTVKLSELGEYDILLDLTDADGDRGTSFSDTFRYLIAPVFDPLTVDPTTVDIDHRTSAVSGRLLGRWPDTRELKPLGGKPVILSTGSADDAHLVTDGEGRFSAVAEILGPSLISASYYQRPEDLTASPAGTVPVEVTVHKATTRLSVQVDRPVINAGEQVTLSGKLEYQTAAGWQPYGGVFVEALFITVTGNGPSRDLAKTSSDGTYSLTLIPPISGSWRIEYDGRLDPYHGDTYATASVQVIQPVTIGDFSASRKGRQVAVRGRLQIPAWETPLSMDLDIEYSLTGQGGWAKVASLTAATTDGTFAGNVSAARMGYWRARYPGDGRDFPAAVSGTVRA
jgi:hypothetical protein